jgi:hypothetical protein
MVNPAVWTPRRQGQRSGMGSHGFDTAEYVSAKITEIEESLAALDGQPNTRTVRHERQWLTQQQAHLIAWMAAHSEASALPVN